MMLARHLFDTFLMLRDPRLRYVWGSANDNSTRSSEFFGLRHQGQVHYALGFSGLGAGATQFAAQVLCARMEPHGLPVGGLRLVGGKPISFPRERLRFLAGATTGRSLICVDADGGHWHLCLRTRDRFEIGSDS
jgi:hypothetical protein